jgi:hypothetical protein
MRVFDRLREVLWQGAASRALPGTEEPVSGTTEDLDDAMPPADDVALRSTAMRDIGWTDNLTHIEERRAQQDIRKERAAADQRIRQRTAAWLLGSGSVLLFLIAGVPVAKAVQGQAVMTLGVWTLLLLLVLGAGVVVGIFFLIGRLLRDSAPPSEERRLSEAAASGDPPRVPGQRTAPAGSPPSEADARDLGGEQ